MSKDPFLSQAMKYKNRDQAENALVFLRWEDFQLESDGEFTKQPFAGFILLRFTDDDDKQTASLYHGVWDSH